MDQKSIFRIVFQDKTEFMGGTIADPKWKNCPEKKIAFLEVLLPYDDKITLLNYEKFNFFIGATKAFGGNAIKVLHLYASGCNEKVVTSYRITLSSERNQKYRVGDITVRKFPFGKEGIGQTPTSGWK